MKGNDHLSDPNGPPPLSTVVGSAEDVIEDNGEDGISVYVVADATGVRLSFWHAKVDFHTDRYVWHRTWEAALPMRAFVNLIQVARQRIS